ncbi:MAG: hypothetical protein PHU85_17870, partial [Phycisphaerae bacterium]|nr:hypothetical protein [Phycisphaerae bacterium]
MKRRVILFTIALVGILGAMGIYLAANSEPPSAEPPKPITPAAMPANDELKKVPGDQLVGPAKNIQYPHYVMETHRVNGEIVKTPRLAAVIQGDKSVVVEPGHFRLTDPEIWYILKDARILYLRADEGDFFAAESAKAGFNPTHGELRGKVFLSMNRGKGAPESPAGKPDESIRVWGIEKIQFDLTVNLIETDSIVRMETTEVDAAGKRPKYSFDVRGLSIRWDAVTREITDLRMNTHHAGPQPFAGRLIAYRGMDIGGEPKSTTKPDKAATGSAAATKPHTLTDPSKVQTYQAKFNDDVEILAGIPTTAPELAAA